MALARRLILVLVGLTALGGTAAYFATQMGLTNSAAGARNLGWLVFALMTILSIVLILAIWRRLAVSLRRIRRQLDQFESDMQIGMIMVETNDELANLVGALNHYLTSIRSWFDKDHQQQKELQLQAGAAEAERGQMEAIIFGIAEAVLVTDEYDELLTANRAGEALLGFRLSESRHRPIEDVISDTELLELIRQTRQTKSIKTTCLLQRPGADNSRILSFKVFLSCVLDSAGQVKGVVVVIHDMTAEQELAQMKDDFVSNVSHELKTPLASIRAYAEMLGDNEAHDEAARHDFCTVIQEQADRLNRLIDDILNISRIESGALHMSKKRINLMEIIDDVIETVRPQAREKNIELCWERTSDDLQLLGDRDMIYQSLVNLVSNALKYSLPGRAVWVRTRGGDNHQVHIDVQDEGVGIPEDCLDRIFDKFYRVEQNNHLAGGTGLGLHLVRQIVEGVHHGRVTVNSTPEVGSTFTVTLGLCEAEQPARA